MRFTMTYHLQEHKTQQQQQQQQQYIDIRWSILLSFGCVRVMGLYIHHIARTILLFTSRTRLQKISQIV